MGELVARYSASARDDLKRLYAYLLNHATTIEDLDQAGRALATIIGSVGTLSHSPFIYRKAGPSPFLRELIIPFGHRVTSLCSRSTMPRR